MSGLRSSVAESAAKRLRETYGVTARDILEMFRHSQIDLSGATVAETVKEVRAWYCQTDAEYRATHGTDDQ